MDLLPEPESGRTARQAVLALSPKLDPETMAKLRLLVTELVVAALAPAETRTLRLVVRKGDGVVRAELEAAEHGAKLTGPRSWSLFLVNRIADRWGTGDTAVWFELDAA